MKLPRRQPPEYGSESGPTSDDEPIYSTPHRELIAKIGRLASAEQAHLEREYRLQDGRKPRRG